MLLRQRFVWWPLHPIGFLAASAGVMRYAWLSVLIVWAVKFMVVRYGGARVYGKLRPFFLGLLFGHVFTLGAWSVFDVLRTLLTGREGAAWVG